MGKLKTFFEKIKAKKIKRKYLVIALISTELLGILVLVWFLRIPLSQKFLASAAKAYSVVTLNDQKRYLVSQSDFLTGKAIPGTNVKVLITPGFIRSSVTADSSGNWSYQVPQELPLSTYRFSFGNFDKSKKLVTFQSYKFRVQSNVSLFRLLGSAQKKLASTFSPKSANAQVNTGLSPNFYTNLGLPAPNGVTKLTDDEKFRFEHYFAPYAYPASRIAETDMKLMAMWIFTEAYLTNYMDNCLDSNKEWGEDADLNQNTTCTGWGKDGIPNWQVGWGIFPYQWVDRLPEAIALMRPGESIQQIGQRVIDESSDQSRYPTRGIVTFKPPFDPITNPEIFPDDVTLEDIVNGSKPVGDGEQIYPCPRTEEDQKNFHPSEDPKNCQMRQLLGILMKDPAISSYFLALMWKDISNRGLASTFKNWGPEYVNGKRVNPYANLQEVSNTIAAFQQASVGLDLDALSSMPQVVIPSAVSSVDSQGSVRVSPVISEDGNQIPTPTGYEVQVFYGPSGSSLNDYLVPRADINVKGVNNIEGEDDITVLNEDNCQPECTVQIQDPEVINFPENYSLCVALKLKDLDIAISKGCVPLIDIVDPPIPVDQSATSNQPENFNEPAPQPEEIINESEYSKPQPIEGPIEPNLESAPDEDINAQYEQDEIIENSVSNE